MGLSAIFSFDCTLFIMNSLCLQLSYTPRHGLSKIVSDGIGQFIVNLFLRPRSRRLLCSNFWQPPRRSITNIFVQLSISNLLWWSLRTAYCAVSFRQLQKIFGKLHFWNWYFNLAYRVAWANNNFCARHAFCLLLALVSFANHKASLLANAFSQLVSFMLILSCI